MSTGRLARVTSVAVLLLLDHASGAVDAQAYVFKYTTKGLTLGRLQSCAEGGMIY